MDEMKSLPIWVVWKSEVRNGKKTKVPYQANGKLAASNDPDTWTTYDKAKEFAPQNGGVGIIFEQSAGIIGIDFDHVVEDDKITNDKIASFIKRAKTYAEYSPSGTGVHLLFHTVSKITLVRNKKKINDTQAIEIYTTGRYFTFTGNELPESRPILSIDDDAFIQLISELGYPWDADIIPSISEETGTSILSDDEIVQKMFKAKNGKNVQKLWNGDISAYNSDESSADFSLCLSLAFWTRKDKTVMERLWLQSPLGSRTKTKERADYRARTIANAVNACSKVYEPIEERIERKKKEVSKQLEETHQVNYEFMLSDGKDPQPELIFPNILRALRKNPLFIGTFRLNDFSHMAETCFNTNGEWVNLNDEVISHVRECIAEEFPFFRKISMQLMTEAIRRVAGDTRVNPPRDYITQLVWDGTPRIGSWLHHAYGVPDDAVHQAIGSNWLKGLVKRVIQPGCQFDEVLALESKQGWRKSTSIRELGKPWHAEVVHSLDKDFYLTIAQNVIVEFSEGEIFDRATVKKLKAEITKIEDQVRPPYERGIVKFKRACVFAVTTNKLELKDETGNRRWLPVTLNKPADIDWIKENRDQLYAEAYHRAIVVGETTYEYPEEITEMQESHTEWNDNDEIIMDWLAGLPMERLEEGVSLREVFAKIFGDNTRQDRLEEIRIAGSLRRLHMDNPTIRKNGKVVRRWVPSEKTKILLSKIQKDF